MARALCVAVLVAAVSAAPTMYTNPVINNSDTPDPGLAFDSKTGLWWAGTTGGEGNACFMLHSSQDLGTWNFSGYAFPNGHLPTWIQNSCWAPELHQMPDGNWLIYYVGRLSNGLLSVGVGISTTRQPGGPYEDPIGAPLITDSGNPGAQGQIDPTLYLAPDGTPYLIWKTDGNADGQKTPIRIAKLTPNGTALASGPDWHTSILIQNDLPWEGAIVEAPWMVHHDGVFYLFYSANGYSDGTYSVGVARSTNAVIGPYEKFGKPILRNATEVVPPFQSPGHCSIVQAPDGSWVIAYHAYISSDRSARHLMIDTIAWTPDGNGGLWPAMSSGQAEPGVGPQPVP